MTRPGGPRQRARRAVFLDKDGTLVRNVPYNVDPARIVLMRGAAEAVRAFAARGYRVIVVSNQPGIALGKFSSRALNDVENRLRQLLPDLHGFYYCPHAPHAACGCRKPAPGLLERAAREHGIDLAGSWMIGDILDDIEAGRRAGCRTVLLDNGNETEWRLVAGRVPHRVAYEFSDVAALVLEQEMTAAFLQ
jgi:D-glycero-D-manno-heptose 1,7-bisphosphate phosphatase